MEYTGTENQGHLRRKTMTEQTKVKPSYAGICRFCRGEFEKAKMSQHLKHCKERARMEAETAKSPEGKQFIRTKLFHIVLEGKYNPQYWMHIEVPAEAQLILRKVANNPLER
jgi:hypothetical protein